MAVSKATTKADVEAPAPEKPSDGLVRLVSPWGSNVTVAEDLADEFKVQGYKPSK